MTVIWIGPFSKDYWSGAKDFPHQILTLKQIMAKYLQKWGKIKKKKKAYPFWHT